jgi:predicted dehydrogenase
MSTAAVRIGIVGCGIGARIGLDRFLALDRVAIAGCADLDMSAARALADRASSRDGSSGTPIPAFADHRALLRQVAPDALAIFTPPLSHYRLTMNALQAGCHVFIDKPLSTNVQEATDIVRLAAGRNLNVGVAYPLRQCASVNEAKQKLGAGAIGPVHLITASITRPSSTSSGQTKGAGLSGPSGAGDGVLADAGDDVIDVLLWTTGQAAHEAAAFQARHDPGIDLVTAAAIKLADGTQVALGISGISPVPRFAFDYFGELGRLHVTDQAVEEQRFDEPPRLVPLPRPTESIERNFVAALAGDSRLCCPAERALEVVRLLDAIARSAATGQIVRLI